MMAYVNRAHLTVTPTQFVQQKFTKEMPIFVLDEDTGKLMEYRKLINNPKYRPLYQKYYAKEIGQMVQGMSDLV